MNHPIDQVCRRAVVSDLLLAADGHRLRVTLCHLAARLWIDSNAREEVALLSQSLELDTDVWVVFSDETFQVLEVRALP